MHMLHCEVCNIFIVVCLLPILHAYEYLNIHLLVRGPVVSMDPDSHLHWFNCGPVHQSLYSSVRISAKSISQLNN